MTGARAIQLRAVRNRIAATQVFYIVEREAKDWQQVKDLLGADSLQKSATLRGQQHGLDRLEKLFSKISTKRLNLWW